MVIEKNWVSEKSDTGIYSCSGEDGKIDGFNVTNRDDCVVVQAAQMKFSEKLSTKDIGNFFESFKKYIIDKVQVMDTSGYRKIPEIQKWLSSELKRNKNKNVKYQLFVVFKGNKASCEDNINAEFKRIFHTYPKNVELNIVDGDELLKSLDEVEKAIREDDFKELEVSIIVPGENYSTRKIEYIPKGSDNKCQLGVIVGTIDGKSINHIIESEFEANLEVKRLFNNNVRGFLSDSSINMEIGKTLENEPALMVLKNNGAVIICDEAELISVDSLYLRNPVIINGQQTFCTTYLNKGFDLDEILVPVKIISIPSTIETKERKKLFHDISKSSNQANDISNLDLIANSDFIVGLKKEFSKLGIYLKVKAGELLNGVYVESNSTIDLKFLLNLWAACVLKRMDYSKSKKKTIDMIYDGVFKTDNQFNPYFSDEKNSGSIYKSFIEVNRLLDYSVDIDNYFDIPNHGYIEHGKFMVYFLLYQKYRIHESSEKIDTNKLSVIFAEINSIICRGIDLENERKNNDNKLYSHNTYFKSTRPVSDYDSKVIFKVSETLRELII